MHPTYDFGRPPIQFADDRDSWLISAGKVVQQLHLQLGDLARLGRLDPERLATDPGSADIQRLLAHIVRVFTAATAVFMSDTAASAWMMEPLRAFRDKTAFGLIVEGRTEEVIRYLDSIESGFVG